ncbi:MAG: flagellar motor protein MotA [Dokdonella sp.]
MNKPSRVLIWMIAFLGIVAVLAVLLAPRLADIFSANPFFNGVILLVLASGIAVNLRQVLILRGDIDWIDNFRRSDPERVQLGTPRLLAPMARMLAGRERGRSALSAASMRTLLDSVHLRLEESRDLSRYLIGLAIFLGLLGTFWGLLVTIRSVSDIIGTLNVGNDALTMFSALKENLKQPLGGMSTSFSTSLFGLASSLIIGFLDLQAGHAQNRFYNDLEEWLSGMTRLASGGVVGDGDASVPAYVQALLEQTADGLERMQRAIVENDRERHTSNTQLGELSTQLGRLTDLLARDTRDRAAHAESQDELRIVLRQLANQSQPSTQLSDELRSEFRLLSRTIAAALEGRAQRPAAPRTRDPQA